MISKRLHSTISPIADFGYSVICQFLDAYPMMLSLGGEMVH